jgi:hypothetical protein
MTWRCPLVHIAGGWHRTGRFGGVPMAMGFLSRSRAENYGLYGLSAIDPYERELTGPIRWEPGIWFRRTPAKFEVPFSRSNRWAGRP